MLKKLLYKLSAGRPCRLIHSNDRPYLERYYLGQFLGMTFYLHRFVACDGDRALHDHPWKFCAALCLSGGYREKRLLWFNPETGFDTTIRQIRPGRLNIIRISNFHQILETTPDTWTLFAHTPKVKSWGFLDKITPHDADQPRPPQPQYQGDADTTSHQQWWRNAPLGRDAGRAPL